ncbi:long-chain acyl-CoA synthetase [Desulfacinum hydrothermale DSM 13146]|uniref:Long-chain acyl-CoA synthetase n=1 Tax=Desulfacinum hydrothermale DSM 13146 TaxID=1121390 RepID=A0A1W1X6Z8_9BACT|nr:long-chain fatty acid--CoA ligase [Desulfacinum hydrothermale]SMC19584.1 long-chain acyl-CoA synthetase [Desulfacinum hydrothermale DSM 13146]
MDRLWYRHYNPKVPHQLDYPDKPLPVLLEQTVAKYPRNVATYFMGATLTYKALWDQIQRMATALRDLGVQKGDRVGIMLPNCPQTIVAYYATLQVGAVAVMTNPMYVEREMEHQWNDAGVQVVFTLDHLYPKVDRAAAATRVQKIVATSLRECLPFPLKWLYPLKARKDKLFTAVPYDDRRVFSFTRLLRQSAPSTTPCPATLEDLALLQYTGGTTGVSKGVMLSHANILANVIQICGWNPELQWGKEKVVGILPFFHVFGMTVAMNQPLYTGATIILLPRFEIDSLLKTLHKTKPTLFPGVPTIYVAIVNHPKIKEFDLSSIRFCITGSAPMPLEILKKFEEITGGLIIEGYGLSEASPVTHVNPIGALRKPGSIGVPVPDTDCRIISLEDGVSQVPVGEVGELAVKGPQVMKGYWNMPEETAQTLRDGWLYTGDIAKMDEDGFVYIVDRKKDMIIAGGYNIYPREVDEVLYAHPKVLDAVTVGVPDPYRGETVKAFVVPKPGETVTPEEIIAFCKSKLAAYKVPKAVEIRESLPKTMVGKILRKELREEEIRKYEQSKASS